MWEDIFDILEDFDDKAYKFAEETCLRGDEESFEVIYKDKLREGLVEIREILTKNALRIFRR
jgi:hypothetical protein